MSTSALEHKRTSAHRMDRWQDRRMCANRRTLRGTSNPELYERVRGILTSARSTAARSVNSIQVVANWLVGREIVEEEQKGEQRAEYGRQVVESLAKKLTKDFGPGYSALNLWWFRRLFLEYPRLIDASATASDIESASRQILYAPRKESWVPGILHPNLSWTHYRLLLKVEACDARRFYEIEALNNSWSTRELERQIASLLFERLAMSRNKRGLMRLATKGQEIAQAKDVFKDPLVVEFVGLPQSHELVESNLEAALISNLQAFLLELGKGFAFVARQQRLTLDGDHFYIDLVFYHAVLKCYVLIDLKVGKITHADLGQLQLYVNYYDMERRTPGDDPTLGLILCSDKNEAVVKYTLGPAQEQKIFASRYKLHLPSEAELRRELRSLRRGPNAARDVKSVGLSRSASAP